MLGKTINSFAFALKGLWTVWKEENNFRIQVIIGVIVIILTYYFGFTLTEKVFCLLVITIVLTAEIFNTMIEDLCNKVEPKDDPIIGKIKDMSSGAVLVSSLGAIIIGLIIFLHHFWIV